MRTQKMCLTLTTLLGLSWALPATATDYEAADYLPLTVGNSWTYLHDYYVLRGDYSQWSSYTDEFPQFTIEVLRSEEIDGQTYYMISDIPAFWPPAPPHFIAGKKLRWEGTHLMEYTGGGERAVYRFEGTNEEAYEIPTVEGDNLVTVVSGSDPVPWYGFRFFGNGEGGRACRFLAGYGINLCAWVIFAEDYPLFINRIEPLHAVIGGNRVDYEDALVPTGSSSSSWGLLKKSILASSTRQENDQ